ncbi:MAG: D-2-hydroxyacid dehydrogenase [Treponemataceae bacterium]|nr:D-2-hydroxyacid dehydrogenase [Treponemataceae bacterium]
MKITVLDGHAANPGDVSWDAIRALGDVTVYDRTPREKIIERIADSDSILLNKIPITRDIVAHCPSLRYIGVLATGYNVVDTAACREKGIIVTNIPAYSTKAVAQHVFAFLLEFTNRVAAHSASVHDGDWTNCPDFCYWLFPLTELRGKTIGIFGFGTIGRKVAEIAHAFGMNVIVRTHSERSYTGGEKSVSTEELFKQSDVVTLHTPLTAETENLVNKTTLALMKPTAYLINTARGGLVDERAVRDALDAQQIAGYATDVARDEPMSADCPLRNAPNCLITPHIAWAPRETRERLLAVAAENIAAFLRGTPQNVVS